MVNEVYRSFRLLIESIGAMVAMREVTNGIYMYAGEDLVILGRQTLQTFLKALTRQMDLELSLTPRFNQVCESLDESVHAILHVHNN